MCRHGAVTEPISTGLRCGSSSISQVVRILGGVDNAHTTQNPDMNTTTAPRYGAKQKSHVLNKMATAIVSVAGG